MEIHCLTPTFLPSAREHVAGAQILAGGHSSSSGPRRMRGQNERWHWPGCNPRAACRISKICGSGSRSWWCWLECGELADTRRQCRSCCVAQSWYRRQTGGVVIRDMAVRRWSLCAARRRAVHHTCCTGTGYCQPVSRVAKSAQGAIAAKLISLGSVMSESQHCHSRLWKILSLLHCHQAEGVLHSIGDLHQPLTRCSHRFQSLRGRQVPDL